MRGIERVRHVIWMSERGILDNSFHGISSLGSLLCKKILGPVEFALSGENVWMLCQISSHVLYFYRGRTLKNPFEL